MTDQHEPPTDARQRAAAYEKEVQDAKDHLDRLHGDDAAYRLEHRPTDPLMGGGRRSSGERPVKPAEYSSELFVPRESRLWPSLVRAGVVMALFGVMAYVVWDALLRS